MPKIVVTVPGLSTREIEFINEREIADIFEFIELIEGLRPRFQKAGTPGEGFVIVGAKNI